MAVLVLLWVGTLALIYSASFIEVSQRNRGMLREHSDHFMLENNPLEDMNPDSFPPVFPPDADGNFMTGADLRNGPDDSSGKSSMTSEMPLDETESRTDKQQQYQDISDNDGKNGDVYPFEMKPDQRPEPGKNKPGRYADMPEFQLSTFYSVALDKSVSESSEDVQKDVQEEDVKEQILDVRNPQESLHTDDELEELARRLVREGKTSGISDDLIYLITDKGDYTLVAFKDNTIINESMTTLFRYTLIFGAAAIILLFFVAVYLAKRIVSPLEESYKKQKQFVSDAGHELKTPIAVISTNADLLSREIGDNTWLDNIQYENERMGMLVSQLLDLSRVENAPLLKEPVDLSRLVYGEVLPFESLAFENGKNIDCEIAEGIQIEGSAAQLKQLVAILVDNAIEHSDAGSAILVRLFRDHSNVALSVINDGAPIPKDKQTQLFERFYRMDKARTGDENHYGLGLAIARAVATAHEGSISLRCENDKIEFRVLLPMG